MRGLLPPSLCLCCVSLGSIDRSTESSPWSSASQANPSVWRITLFRLPHPRRKTTRQMVPEHPSTPWDVSRTLHGATENAEWHQPGFQSRSNAEKQFPPVLLHHTIRHAEVPPTPTCFNPPRGFPPSHISLTLQRVLPPPPRHTSHVFLTHHRSSVPSTASQHSPHSLCFFFLSRGSSGNPGRHWPAIESSHPPLLAFPCPTAPPVNHPPPPSLSFTNDANWMYIVSHSPSVSQRRS